MATEVKGGLGFDLSPLFIVVGVIWALTVHNASSLIKGCTNLNSQGLGQMFQTKQITQQLHLPSTRGLLKCFSTRGTMTTVLG
jgi:hypothetical protein